MKGDYSFNLQKDSWPGWKSQGAMTELAELSQVARASVAEPVAINRLPAV